MNGPSDKPELSQDQLARIAETLKRIRSGLARAPSLTAPEPAHVFTPRMQDAK